MQFLRAWVIGILGRAKKGLAGRLADKEVL